MAGNCTVYTDHIEQILFLCVCVTYDTWHLHERENTNITIPIA